MKKTSLVLFVLFSIPVLSQVEFKMPAIDLLDSFNGKFAKVVMKEYEFNDTFPFGKNDIPNSVVTLTYNSQGQKTSYGFLLGQYDWSVDTFIYDKAGMLVQYSERSLDGPGSENYYVNGRKTTGIYYVPESDAGFDTMKYDKKGRLVEVYHYGQVCPEGYTDHYYYDKEGRMCLFETTPRYGKAETEFFRKDSVLKTYDKKGKLISEKTFMIDYSKPDHGRYTVREMKLVYETTFTYSCDETIVVKSTNSPGEKKKFMEKFVLSSSGLLLSKLAIEEKENPDGALTLDSAYTVCTYDSPGFLKTHVQQTRERTWSWKYEIIFNAEGNPESCIEYFDNNKWLLFTWEYTR